MDRAGDLLVEQGRSGGAVDPRVRADPQLAEETGARIAVEGKNYDETVTLKTDAGSLALGGAAAARVWITPDKTRSAR